MPARADLYIANSAADTVYASKLANDCGFSTGTITTGDRPLGLAVHPDGTRLYVANSGAGTVSVIDTAARSTIASIPVGGAPVNVVVHPNGARAYAITGNRVVVIDTASNGIVSSIPVVGIANGIAIHPAGTHIYVGTQAGYLTVINPGSNSIFTQFPIGAVVFGVAFNPSGTRAYAATTNGIDTGWVTVLDVASSGVVTTVPMRGTPINVAVNPDGARAYVVTDVDEQREVPEPGLLTAIDTATNAVSGAYPTGRAPYGIAIDAKHIYVTNQLDANVSVFDLDTQAQVDLMEVGSTPLGVATFVHPPPPPLPADIRVTGIEVTQGIQDLSHSVTLVADRRTFARVYMRADPGPTVFNVTGALFGIHEDCTTSGCNGLKLGTVQPVAGNAFINVVANPVRANFGDSLLFELPWEWITGKPLRLYFVPGTVTARPTACRSDAPTTEVAFDRATSTRIQFIRAQYDSPTTPNTFVTATRDEQLHSESWLRRAFPISELVPGPGWVFYDQGLLSRVDQSHPDCQALPEKARSLCARHYLATLPALFYASSNQDGAYVLIPQSPTIPFTRGACCNDTRLGAGPSDPANPAAYAFYTAHELGHLFGRKHPEENATLCDETHDPDPNPDPGFPYDYVLIHPYTPYDTERGLAGFDAGDPARAQNTPRRHLGLYSSHDVMGYCDPATLQWVSDYTYENLYNTLLVPQPPVFGSGAGGPILGDWLMVLGNVMPQLASPAQIQTRRLDRVTGIPSRTPGDHSIRLLNASGATLADYSFAAEVAADATVGSGAATRSFAHIVPFVTGARTIQIIEHSAGTRIIGTKTISATAPTIANVTFQGSPTPGSTSVTLQWIANDVDGDALTYDLVHTKDDGNTLQPVMLGLTARSARVDLTELGGGLAKFRVVASDGVQTRFADSPPLDLAIKAPRPRILSHGPEVTILSGQLVNLEGAADDLQDGRLPSASLSWLIPGRTTRTGSRLSISDLALGSHDITLMATNSAGASATATLRITVDPNEPPQQTELTVGPQQLGWQVAVGTATRQTATLHVGSIGAGATGFTATTNAAWLTVQPASSAMVPASITVSADPTGVADGTTKAAQITLTATGATTQPLTVPVTLSVGNTWATGGAVAPDASCANDVSPSIVVTRGGLRLNRATNRYVQQLTVRNAGGATVGGPVVMVLDGLGSTVTLANKTGTTSCATPHSAYIAINAGADNALSPAESVTVTLEFSNPTNQTFTYSTRVLSGSHL